ncbi:hypothetical protein WJ94_19205 [Burkholderia ubonensis]|uniref:hypothetical protein n=1 Tax=Burkholderia ubonensis TaxID=101571 RepID=UPI00075F2689|nr:hypothetical protein [Burkholderia ubonensis]KVP76375.1 hypothetical protein WJ94_19205 [Burkholderia ubonensis]
MSDQIKTDMFEAEVPRDLESVPEARADDYPKQPENADATQVAQAPAFEVIATAYDLHGRDPRRVIDFDHASGRRVRRLLPEGAFTSTTRARTALIKAGMRINSVDLSGIVDIAMTRPDAIGMYGILYGWSQGFDAGVIYRFGDTVYSSSGPIPVYAEGPAPDSTQANDIAPLKEVLTAGLSPCSVILVAAHLAGLLVPPLGCDPLVIVASGVSASDAACISSLADSAFGTKAATWRARLYESDDTLVLLSTAKSREQAFQQVGPLFDATARAERRAGTLKLAQAPVTFVVTGEPDAPGNLDSARPPTGSVEISFDMSAVAVAEEAARSSPASSAHFGAVAAKAFIDAVLRNLEPVIRNADKKMPEFVCRYLGMMKGDQSEEAVRIAAATFALLRYALLCGCRFNVVPWDGKEVDAVMDACVTRWSERHQDRTLAFERYVIDAVKTLADTGFSSQRAKPIDRKVVFETVKERELMLIESNTFDAHIAARTDKARALDVLRKRRLLVTNGDGAQYQKRIDGERARFYAVDITHLRTL